MRRRQISAMKILPKLENHVAHTASFWIGATTIYCSNLDLIF